MGDEIGVRRERERSALLCHLAIIDKLCVGDGHHRVECHLAVITLTASETRHHVVHERSGLEAVLTRVAVRQVRRIGVSHMRRM